MAPFSPFSRAHSRGKTVVARRNAGVQLPLKLPWTRPAAHLDCAWLQLFVLECRMKLIMSTPCCSSRWWGPNGTGPSREGATLYCSVLFLARFLTSAFASQRSLHALFLAGLQVKGVAFDLLNDVFLLHLALEAAQSILEGFTLLKSNFRQTDTPPDSSGRTG